MGKYDDEFAEEDLGNGDQALPDMPKRANMDYGDDDDEIIEEAPSDQGAPVAVKPKSLKPPVVKQTAAPKPLPAFGSNANRPKKESWGEIQKKGEAVFKEKFKQTQIEKKQKTAAGDPSMHAHMMAMQ